MQPQRSSALRRTPDSPQVRSRAAHHVESRDMARPQLHYFARRTSTDGGWDSSAQQDRRGASS